MASPIVALSGIYVIRNMVNGKVYVGSSVNMLKRSYEHLHALRKGKHHTRALQHSWKKHGESAFQFEALEHVADISALIEVEQAWIDRLGCIAPNGYNMRPYAQSCLGVVHSAEIRAANSLRRTGVKQSAETIAKRAAALTGQIRSPEARARISAALKGKVRGPQSEERKAATSLALKGIAKHAAWRASLSKAKASLSDDQVRSIRAMRADGLSLPEIGGIIGCSRWVASNICQGRSYRHVI